MPQEQQDKYLDLSGATLLQQPEIEKDKYLDLSGASLLSIDGTPALLHTQKQPQKENIGNFKAYVDGFAQDMTFGGLDPYTDEEVFATNSQAISNVLGQFSSFAVQALALSLVSFGYGGVTLYGAKSARLAKSATTFTNALKKHKAGKITLKSMQRAQAVALQAAGVGTPNTFSFLKWNKNRARIVSNFMKYAAENPAKARRYMLYQEMLRDGTINAALGQKFVNEENLGRPVTFQDRLKYGMQDLFAGSLFGAGRSYHAIRGLDNLGKMDKLGKYSLYFGSGFLQSLPTLEGKSDLNMFERVGMGAISIVSGMFVRGGTVTKAKEDVHNALRDIGITDEGLITQVTDLSLAVAGKFLPKALDDSYAGKKLVNTKTGQSSTIKNFIMKEGTDGKGNRLYIQYEDSAGNLQTEKASDYFKKHRTSDWEKIDRIKNNLDDNDNSISWFRDEKELKHFLKTQKYGIVTAEEGSYVGTYGRNKFLYEDANDELIRVLLAKGYKRKDIMALKGTFGGKKENSFIVKNLKPQDAADIARQFGQDSVLTQTGLIQYMRKGGNINSLDITEITRARNTGKVVFGKKATAELDEDMNPNYSTIKLQNGKSKHFKIDLDWKDVRNIPIKYVEGTMNDVLLRGIYKAFPKFKSIKERKNLISFIKQEEVAYGLDTKQTLKVKGEYVDGNPFENMQHISLKKALYNKGSLTQFTDNELKEYASLLSGRKNIFTDNLNKGILDLDNPSLKELQGITKWGNYILPIVSKYHHWAVKLGNKALGELSADLRKYSAMKYDLEGSYQIFRQEQLQYMRDKLGWLNIIDMNKIDKDLMLFIEKGKGFKQLKQAYKGNKEMLDVIDELVKMHTKWSKDAFKIMRKHGVMEFDYVKNKKTGKVELKLVPIREQKNFVSRQITEDFAEYINKHEKYTREYFIENILKNDKRFKGTGKWAKGKITEKERREIAEEMFGVLTEQRARYGVYGQQFARIADLDPRIFIDKQGRIIKGVKRWDYKKGDMIGDKKVDRVIDVYDLNYGANMDRYAAKYANMTAFTKHFGARGIFKFDSKNNVRTFSDVFKERLIAIQKNIRHMDDQKTVAEALDKDFKKILGGNPLDELSSFILNRGASWTASIGLSGLRSGPKNFFLGQNMSQVVFTPKALLSEWYKLFTSKQAWRDMWREGTEINAFQVSSRTMETARTEGTSIPAKVERGVQTVLTTGMQVGEMANRGTSVVLGRTIADDALEALRNPNLSFEKKGFARRMLMDIFKLSDDPKDLQRAIRTGQFSDEQIAKIRYESHSVTQGIPDAIHMPEWMSGPLTKKATLFYRIAYRMTETVYQNVYKPALRGNPGPMARYLVGTTLTGATIGSMYMAMFNMTPDKFKNAPSQFWQMFIDGEGLGIFSNFGEMDKNWREVPLPAMLTYADRVLAAVSLLVKGAFNAKTAGERDILFSEGKKAFGETIPVWNDIKRMLENNSYDISFPKLGIYGKKSYQEFKNFRSLVRSYNKNIRELEAGYVADGNTSKNIMFETIQGHLYSNTPMDMKVNDVWATIHHVAHMKSVNDFNQGISNQRAFNEAYDLVLENLENQTPLNLTKTRREGRKKSDYEVFRETLTKEEFLMLQKLESLHRKNFNELKREVSKKKHFYFRDVR